MKTRQLGDRFQIRSSAPFHTSVIRRSSRSAAELSQSLRQRFRAILHGSKFFEQGFSEVHAQLDGGVAVGVEETEAVRQLVRKVVGRSGLTRVVDSLESSGRWRIDLSDVPTLEMTVREGYLTLATGDGFHDEVVEASNGGESGGDGGHPALRLAKTRGSSASARTELGLFGAVLLSNPRLYQKGVTQQMVHGPRSIDSDMEEYRQKKAALDQVREKLEDLRADRRAIRRSFALDVVEQFGDTAATVRSEADGLSIYAGKYVETDSVDAAVRDSVVRWTKAQEELRESGPRYGKLRRKQHDLEGELREMRRSSEK